MKHPVRRTFVTPDSGRSVQWEFELTGLDRKRSSIVNFEQLTLLDASRTLILHRSCLANFIMVDIKCGILIINAVATIAGRG